MSAKTRNRCSCGRVYDAATDRLLRKCPGCGAARKPKSRPKHAAALDLPYEVFVAANGGRDECGVCGQKSTPQRRLDRDHLHSGSGTPRGVLCHRHNRLLSPRMGWTPETLRRAADYLEGVR